MTAETTIVGNLTNDPEIKYNATGPSATFAVAVNKRWKDKNGEWTEQVSYFDCVAFGQLAENLAASTSKGNRIVVTGRLQQNTYTANDGTSKSRIQIVATDIGASFMFARCEIERIERTQQTTRQQPVQRANDDEEPF